MEQPAVPLADGATVAQSLARLTDQAAGLGPLELAALLRADQWKRWGRRERVAVEDYLRLLPHSAADRALVLDLISGEVLLREGQGETPGLDEYTARFPDLGDDLKEQFLARAELGIGDLAPGLGPARELPPTRSFQPAPRKLAVPSSPAEDQPPPAARHRLLAWLMVLVLAVVAIGSTVGAVMVWRWADGELTRAWQREAEAQKDRDRAEQLAAAQTTQAEEAQRQATEAAKGRRKAETAAQQAIEGLHMDRVRVAALHYELFEARRRDGQIDAAREVLDKLPADLRGWEWDYLRQLCDYRRLTWEAHPGGARGLSLAGNLLASVGEDGSVRTWRTDTGKEQRRFEGHKSKVVAVALSADGSRLATAGEDGVALVWDVTTGNQVTSCSGHEGSLTGVVFAGDSKRLATCGTDKTVRLWDTATGGLLHKLAGHKSTVAAVAFSPDGKLLASGGWDNRAILWNVDKGERLRDFSGHTRIVGCLTFSPDGKRLLTGSHDITARIWEVETGRELRLLAGHTGSITAVTFSPDGSAAITASMDNTLRGWHLGLGVQLLQLKGRDQRIGPMVTDGRYAFTGGDGSSITTWDLVGSPPLTTLPINSNRVACAAISPDGKRLAAGIGFLNPTERPPRRFFPELVVWDLATLKSDFRVRTDGLMVFNVRFSPDSASLAVINLRGPLRIFDTVKGTVRTTYPLAGEYVVSTMAYNADGSRVAVLEGQLVRVWDAAAMKVVKSFKVVPADWLVRMARLDFSADGRRLLLTRTDVPDQQWHADLTADAPRMEGPAPHEKTATQPGERAVRGETDRVTNQNFLIFTDPGTGLVVARAVLPPGLPPGGALISHDGKRLILLDNLSLKIWNAQASGQ